MQEPLSRKEFMKRSWILLLTALIWGFSFPAQILAGQKLDTFTINSIRFLIGGLFLLPIVKKRKVNFKDRDLWTAGLLCGLCIFAGAALQQIGLNLGTPSGKAGFITSFYIVLVPLFALFGGKKNNARIWIACGIALVGLYLLSIEDASAGAFSFGTGELLTLGSAFVFTAHIFIVDRYATKVDNVAISDLQFFVASILSMPLMFMKEQPQWAEITSAWGPLLFLGLLSSGLAFTLQIVGQRGMNPSYASILLSLESCFSVLGGYLIFHDQMSGREWTGCALMFIAIILAQLPDKEEKESLP